MIESKETLIGDEDKVKRICSNKNKVSKDHEE